MSVVVCSQVRRAQGGRASARVEGEDEGLQGGLGQHRGQQVEHEHKVQVENVTQRTTVLTPRPLRLPYPVSRPSPTRGGSGCVFESDRSDVATDKLALVSSAGQSGVAGAWPDAVQPMATLVEAAAAERSTLFSHFFPSLPCATRKTRRRLRSELSHGESTFSY